MLQEEPLPRMLGALSAETPGEETRRGGQEEATVPWGAQPLLTGAPSLPGRTPCLLSLPARGASYMAGAGPHPARPQALSSLMEDVSLIVHTRLLWCAQ